MATLILQFDGRILKVSSVGLLASIGRLPDNTVRIDNQAVSGHHACVFRDGADFVVEDLDSTNGTFVNNERVSRRVLRSGDVLLVGKHTLLFDQTADEEPLEGAGGAPLMPDIEGTVYLDTRQHKALLARLEHGESPSLVGASAVPPRPHPAQESSAVVPAEAPLARFKTWLARGWRGRSAGFELRLR